MLALGVGNAWGETVYFEGFEENHRTSGNNSYTASANTYGDWTLTYADAAASGNPLTGTAHVIMRVAKNTTNSPSLVSKALLSDKVSISKVSWNCKGNTAQTLKVSYSTNGNTWTEKYSAKLTTSKANQSFTLDNVPGPIYLKFVVSVASSTGSNRDANIDDITIEGTALSSEEPAYSVTVTQPAEGGSIEADKNEAKAGDIVKLTATPSTGYNFDTWTVTGASGTVSVTDNQFTMPAEEVTVTASFEAKTQHTISWSVNGETKTLTPANVYEGDALGTLPTPDPSDICPDKVFAGWTTATNKDYKHATDAPEFITKDTKPSANTTYYAVFATEGEGAAEPEEVTWSYSFSSFSGTSVQYAEETHDLGGGVIIKIKGCHINTTNDDFRIYGSQQERYVISNKLPGAIKSMSFNVGYKSDNLLVYGSTDGSTWAEVGSIATTTAYADKSIDFGETNYTYFKLNVEGANQLRLKKMSVTYMSEGGVTTTYSDYTTSCGATPTIYNVTIAGDIQNGTVTASPTSAAEGATITLIVTPADGYMLNTLAVADESSNLISLTDNTFEMPASNVTVSATFKEIPAATLTLSKNDVEETFPGEHKVGDVITLPDFTSDCSKTFVGWDADENCDHAPTYAPGASYTLASTSQTLYAVYATAAEGELTSIFSETFDACDGTGGNDGEWSGTVAQGDLPDELSSTWTFIKGTKANECAKFGTSSVKGSAETPAITLTGSAMLTFKSAAWDGSKEQTTLNVSATGATLSQTSVTLDKGSWNAYTIGITEAIGSVKIKFEAVVDDNNRFFLDDVVVSQGSITYSDYSTTCTVAPDAPEFSVAAGTYNAAQTVTITAEDGATIYYTLDGNNPTNESTVYSSALTISETTTLKAIAVKAGLSSAITTATYTIKLPLTTIDQIFAKAKEVDGTATAVEITMGGWTVSGANDKNVFVTDGTKGFIIYKNDGGHGFNVGDVLSGTVACKVQLFKGSAELTELTSTTSGLTVTAGGTVTPVTLDAAGITALTGVNTGSVIKINGTCTLEDSKYYVAGVQLYKTLYEFQTLEPSAEYNVTGVYQLYIATKEILPRQEADIEKIESLPTATISIADITMEVEETKTITATIYPAAAADAVAYSTTSSCISISGNTITALTEGTATVTATIAPAAEYYGATKDFTVTVTPKSTKDKVVILAEYDGQWYAMMAQYVSGKTSHLAALPVSYVGGKLYNVADADKTLIEWDRAVVDGKATFSNNSKYLTGKSDKTDLTLAATSCNWTISGESYLIGERTFFYNAENNWFRNFGTSNAGNKNYSGMPVVTAPVYTTGTLYTIKATAENGTVIGAGVYVAGDKVTLTADPAMDYTFVNWTVGGAEVSTANPYVFEATENLDLVANFAEISQTSKTLTGEFSVGQYEVAQFATGNLQYNVKNKEWSFAKQQYQYIGEANINVGDDNYKGWIDMFGWSNGDANNFGVNPSCNKNLYTGEFDDWGTKMGEGWLTLSDSQWDYLLNKRGAGKKQIARVGTVFGVLLFPDEWEMPSGISVTAVYDNDFKVNVYNYTLAQWAALENAGALFLPAAGRRFGGYGNTINYDGTTDLGEEYKLQYCTNDLAAYWTSTKHNDGERVSYLLNLGNGGAKYSTLELGWYEYGHVGQSVRLAKVTDVTPATYTRTTGVNNWGTICLPYASSSFTGATFYEVSSLVVGEGLWLDQLADGDQLVAGKPYIFQATATEIAVTYTGEAVGTPIAGVNGLTGTFTDIAAGGDLVGNYIIAENKVWVAGSGATLSANRAYIDATGVPTTAQAQLPGRRRVCMGENAATGFENVTNGENTTIKVIENGQLIIIRNGEKFNAQGQKL